MILASWRLKAKVQLRSVDPPLTELVVEEEEEEEVEEAVAAAAALLMIHVCGFSVSGS